MLSKRNTNIILIITCSLAISLTSSNFGHSDERFTDSQSAKPTPSSSDPSSQYRISTKSSQTSSVKKGKFKKKSPLPEVKKGLVRFKAKYGSDTKVIWSDRTGLPKAIYDFVAKTSLGKQEVVAKQFILEHQDLFLQNESIHNLRLLKVRKEKLISHVDYQQTYQNIPIHRGVVSVHFRGDKVSMVNGSYVPEISCNTIPKYRAEDAIDVARLDAGIDEAEISVPKLVIDVSEEKPELCWNLSLSSQLPPASWEYLISAESNQIVKKIDHIFEAEKTSPQSGFHGVGRVYDDNSVVTPQTKLRTFKNLDGSGYLVGDVVGVYSYNAQSSAGYSYESYSADLRFNHKPSNRRFAEQNLYYHVNQVNDFFFEKFKFTQTRPTVAIAHVISARGNAFSSTYCVEGSRNDLNNCPEESIQNRLTFGTPTDYRNNLALDAEVIYHEFGHSVNARRAGNAFYSMPYGRAMNEAYADYFSSTIFNDPCMGEGASPGVPCTRRLDNSKTFPQDVVEESQHATGLIWGGSLWDLRNSLGASVTDQLAYNSLSYLPRDGSADFQQGLLALIQADQALYDGSHLQTIRQVLNNRGIKEPYSTKVVSIASGEVVTDTAPAPGPGYSCRLFNTQYTIEVPVGSSTLNIDLLGADNVDLYARREIGVGIEDGKAVADFSATSSSSNETITVTLGSTPSLESGTYFIAIANCASSSTNFSLSATVIASSGGGGTDEVPLTSGTWTDGTIVANPVDEPGSSYKLGSRQFVIDVPAGASVLTVYLFGANSEMDLDLLVRRGERIEIDDDDDLVADARSQTPTHLESLVLDDSSSPKLIPGGRYYIAVANYAPIEGSFTLKATHYTGNFRASRINLESGVPVTQSLLANTLDYTNYVIKVPYGASQLRIDLEHAADSNLYLYARRTSRILVYDNSVVSNHSATLPSNSQTLLIDRDSSPPLDTYYYFISVWNPSSSAIDFTLTATVTQGGGAQLNTMAASGLTVSNFVPPAEAGGYVLDGDQFFVDIPETIKELKVEFQGESGKRIFLVGRFGQRVELAASGIDYVSDYFGWGKILINLNSSPPIEAGRYYFAIVNASSTGSDYDLTFTASTVMEPANLVPLKPPGWSDRIVVSNQQGNTTDSPVLTSSDTLYVDWAVKNTGTLAATDSFKISLSVDGQVKQTWISSTAMGPGSWRWDLDFSIGSLSLGSHTVTIVADPTGVVAESNESDNTYTKTITVTPPTANTSSFVPIVLSLSGLNDSYFTSEMVLTNRGTQNATLNYTYRAAFGGGTGTGSDTLAAGRQKIVPDAISYLASLGIPIPGSGSRGGTLEVEFSGASDVGVMVRTSTAVPDGRAGLAYAGIPSDAGLTETVYLCGLRQNSTDRSNVAVQNSGTATQGNITLRVTIFSGNKTKLNSTILPSVTLPPGGFYQFSGILNSYEGTGTANGFVKVERVAGTAPFYAYGVINDQANSDGSFVFPVTESSLVGKIGQTLPVIVETTSFNSELIVTNFSSVAKTIQFSFVADAIQAANNTANFNLTLQSTEQIIIPNIVEYLRVEKVAGIGSRGTTFAGALFASVISGDMNGVVIGARTGSPGGGGQYGLFYNAVPFGASSTGTAGIDGLQQNAENRSNLAIINTGEIDNSSSVFEIDIYDGVTGILVKTVSVTVASKKWYQIGAILTYAPGTTQGYVKVRKTAGNNPFITYGVINDGGSPGQRSGDGAYIPAQ